MARRALAPAGIEFVLLKGAAYVGQDLPIAAGRLSSDLDIMVPPVHLLQVQARLAVQQLAA